MYYLLSDAAALDRCFIQFDDEPGTAVLRRVTTVRASGPSKWTRRSSVRAVSRSRLFRVSSPTASPHPNPLPACGARDCLEPLARPSPGPLLKGGAREVFGNPRLSPFPKHVARECVASLVTRHESRATYHGFTSPSSPAPRRHPAQADRSPVHRRKRRAPCLQTGRTSSCAARDWRRRSSVFLSVARGRMPI